MSRATRAISANGDTFISYLNPPQVVRNELGQFTLVLQGTFGGGTATPKLSFDAGVTLIPIEDINGSNYTITANRRIQFLEGHQRGYPIQLWLSLAGATSPALTAYVIDGS